MQAKSSVGILLVVSVAAALAHPHHVVAGPCACNTDVNNSHGGTVTNVIDVAIIHDCARIGSCAGCVNDCDVDCDGDVDYYDAGVAACAFQGQSNCCSEPDGACTGASNNTPPCVVTTDNFCNLFTGTWHGDLSVCAGNEAVNIPAASTWGLIVLAMTLMTASTLLIRRRVTPHVA